MCRAVINYLASLRQAWNKGWQAADNALTAAEESQEVWEPQSSRAATPPAGAGTAAAGVPSPHDPTGSSHPTCPYCEGELCCAAAAEDVECYRWEHGLIWLHINELKEQQ